MSDYPSKWYSVQNITIMYMFLCDVINMCPPSFKISTRKLQTWKKCNKNSPDLVYHQLVPARFYLLWFETDPAMFTQLTIPVCYICHHFAMNIIMVQGLPSSHSKISQMPLLEQSTKYSSRQNFRPYGTS